MLVKKRKKFSKIKTPKQMERHFKGVANHRRIEIMSLVNKHEGIELERIAEELRCNIKTISVHTQKLVQAGLLNKRHKGRAVSHSLSPYGKKFYRFMTTF